MLKNYFRTAWRTLRHNKIFSFINVAGLSIGISASLVIFLIVSYDLSFDRSHADGDRIYRIVGNMTFSGEVFHSRGVPMPLARAVRKDLAGLDLVAPFYVVENWQVSIPAEGKAERTVFKNQDHLVFADASGLQLVGYEWLAGSPAISLSQPYQVVLTETSARLYFPKLSPDLIVGRRIYFNDTVGTTVTGIVKDLPYHTNFTFRTFISRSTLEQTSLKPPIWERWGAATSSFQVFVKLAKNGSAAQMERNINAVYQKYVGPSAPRNGNKTEYSLQPLSELHFNQRMGAFFRDDHLANKPTLYSLLIVAGLLLLLACINFINLTTAQSAQRAREIGIRKTIGSSRGQLIVQFLSETFVLTLLALLFSLLLTPFLLKIFSDFIPEGVRFNPLAQPGILVFGLLLLILVSLLSGLYPAAVLSSYRPVQVLKSQLPRDGGLSGRVWLRKTLTISQFVIAQVFVIGTLLVTKQISYSLHMNMGFRKDAVVYFSTNYDDTARSRRLILADRLRTVPGVERVSLSNDIPSSDGTWSNELKYNDGKKEIITAVEWKYADTNYRKLYDLKILAGRDLSYSDTLKEMLINETYLHILGLQNPQEIIEKRVDWDGKMIPIVGVVADFHQKNLHTPIKPLGICSELKNEFVFNVAISPQQMGDHLLKTVIAGMKAEWSQLYPELPFNYQFEDETLAKSYQDDENTARLLRWATGLTIFISCLGLLGLVIYVTNQRTKEIGIRKIVGATVTQIIVLLSADFLKLVFWAFVIAVPIAWWGSHSWLDNFAYKTTLSCWVFVVGGLLMGGIAFLILLLRTFRAARANPAESLRAE